MDEQNKNARRREHIKTLLILFLVIMLLLTFFSNTIMNHSLPTVSAQYAGYGTITEKIRGSGVVTANQNYEVTADGKRTVSKVFIKVGDEVKPGDPLFTLDGAEEDETIQTAEDALQDLELAYQKALLTAAPDYTAENQQIAEARADLQTAINRLNAARNQPVAVSDTGISAADYQQASANYQEASQQVSALSGYLSLISSGETDDIPAVYTTSLQGAKTALDDANSRAAATQAAVETASAALTVTSAEQQNTIKSLERAAETADTAYTRALADYNAAPDDVELQRTMEDAEQTARYAHEDVDAARQLLTSVQAQEKALADAQNTAQQAAAEVTAAQAAYQNAADNVAALIQVDLDLANAQAAEAQSVLTAYENQGSSEDAAASTGTDMDALQEAVEQQQRNLQSLLLTLAKTKKDDQLAQQLNALDLQSQRNAIDRQKETLEKLRKDSGTLNITSKNAGIVSAVSFAAGEEVTPGTSLATITLTDSGYTVQFSVTAEQAKKVKPGTLAEVTNNYYSDITAKLLGSKADTDKPGSGNRILNFEITGSDVSVGQMLALSIPCSSQSYDCVVPNSAIMEDKDGKFVLVMQSKSTPLGNRYYANRANVTVLASDDTNSAVQGDVNASDFIIITSEKPLTPGMQVRTED